MSQTKVDKYKQEKYNRKHNKKTGKAKKLLSHIAITIIAIAFIVYLGYSVAVSTGLYTPPTDPVTLSKTELESLRSHLIEQNDPNVKGVETTAVTEITTAPNSEETTTLNNEETADTTAEGTTDAK